MKFTYRSGTRPLSGYTIKRGIGIGGFGEVYFAISDAGKEVALKKIQRNLDIELRGVRQCLNLNHINLISLWDICVSKTGESWVVMEYVPGQSLRDAIEEHRRGMPDATIRKWFLATAAGVTHLHRHGIVHRDLKPANVFRDDDAHVVKIGDYGLSKFISCNVRSGHTENVGTFHYMAPEIGNGVYGKEVDIYAMGIILFEMITGDVPFHGESVQEIMMKHLTANPSLDRIPPAWHRVIELSLKKDPADRLRSMQSMVAEMPLPPEGFSDTVESTDTSPSSFRRSSGLVDRFAAPLFVSGSDTKSADEKPAQDRASETAETATDGPVLKDPTASSRKFAVSLSTAPHPGARVPSTEAIAAATRATPTNVEPTHASPPTRAFVERVTELVGSMIVQSANCFALSLVWLTGSRLLHAQWPVMQRYSMFAWLTVVSVFGCTALLLESRFGDSWPRNVSIRRRTNLVAGMITGMAAWILAMWFAIPLDQFPITGEEGPGWRIQGIRHVPVFLRSLLLLVICFATWSCWPMTEMKRRRRVDLVPVAVGMLVAASLAFFLGLPILESVAIVLFIGVAVQLASPFRGDSGREISSRVSHAEESSA